MNGRSLYDPFQREQEAAGRSAGFSEVKFLLKGSAMNALNLKLRTLAIVAAMGVTGVVSAEEGSQDRTRNGEHPAVIQARLAAKAGYDYASKFYPHPARLELLAEAPRERSQHPAVLVAAAWKQRGYDYVSKFYLHPARLELLAEAPRERSQHPAVLVAAAWKQRGYDYASKFYLHPARLAWSAEAPQERGDGVELMAAH